MIKHFGIDHFCTYKQLEQDFEGAKLWRHMVFRVYRHSECPETGKKESYLPFLSCNTTLKNFKEALQAIKYRYSQLDRVLGTYSHTRFCTEKDEYLLTRQMLTQATMISFYPERKGRGGFLNRRLIKSKLKSGDRSLVGKARRLPQYKFIKIEQDVFSAEEELIRFWQLCNKSDYIGDEIEQFFEKLSMKIR